MPDSAGDSPGDIAITGMACLFPGADTPARFWANIVAGLEFVGDPLPSWDAARYLGAQGTSHIPTARGGYLGEAFAADPAQLGVMPSSVDGSEPDQFLALRIAQAALADAGGMAPGTDHTRTGIILGHSTYLHRGNAAVVQHGVVLDQTRALLAQLLPGLPASLLDRIRAEMAARLPPFNADIAPGLVPNVMTGRIANRLDLMGPNYIIDAACASSLLAVQAAMAELRAGRSDLMLAGGVNASIPAEVYMVFHQLGALAGSGKVRPFSEGGDGTLLGEGLGVLALRRLADARARGDRIYAVIKGLGQSSDGKGQGLLAPRMEGAVLAIRRAAEDAGQDPAHPLSPGLIEAHGTGIPLGERTELGALAQVFGPRAPSGLPVTAIGSVKSMIGHCIPAAGAAGLIKAALALYHRTLPPTLVDVPRPGMGLDSTPIYVNTAPRPWISAPGLARRASVNAFGFGGVNAHAVLAEADSDGAPAHWPCDLVLLGAATPQELATRARELTDAMARHPRADLAAIAQWAAARAAGQGPCRLAVLATGRDDLADKLSKAAERLEAGKTAFRLKSGVIAADRVQGGKLAFLFPGEGAQYQGMLSEILMAFPAAREWFDFWDGLFPARDMPPSAAVFPPPGITPALAQDLADRLFGLELGSESVFIAAQALGAVLARLGIAPDVVLGHSSGEHSALAAAGVLGALGDGAARAGFATRIRALNQLYQTIQAAGGIPGGALMTLAGIPRARVLALVNADPALHLALDNCEHQVVLYGPRARMEALAADLRAEGGISSFLPFDRPYHTPLFADVAAQVAQVYEGMDFRPARLPLWSCMTAAPMPDDPAAIRAQVAGQWAARVRFTETIAALADDGVTTFVEVGPSANLTGFVEDALKGREVLALPLDSRRHGGLGHLLQALGRFWVSGRDFDIHAIFDNRKISHVDLHAAPQCDRTRVIDNTLAFVRLPDDVADDLSAQIAAALAPSPARLVGPDGPAAPGVVPAPWVPPLLHRLDLAGGNLRAETDIDPGHDPFLAQHVLYAPQVSDLDPALTALPVLPLAVSLEMAVEAAAVLTGQMARRLENVRARDWIAFDDGPATLTTTAELITPDRVAVTIARAGAPLFSADVCLSGATPLPALAPLADPRPPVWQDGDLYTTGMFHGPLYHGIAGLSAWDGTGLDARLADLPLSNFFGDGTLPQGLLLNPALLDQIGHVTAFWIAQGLGTDFSSFPSRIDRIDLGAAREETLAGGIIAGRLGFRDSDDQPVAGPAAARFLAGEFAATSPDGRLIFRASGWRDRFFRVPHAFYEARFRPRDSWYGGPLDGGFAGQPADVTVWSLPAFPPGFLDDAGGIWTRVLAATVLAASERAAFAALPPGKRRRDWLMGRIAAKEAARAWVWQHLGVAMLPADLVIGNDDAGRPFVDAGSFDAFGLGEPPQISLSHAEGAALAAAAPPGQAVGIDLEFGARVDPALLAEGAFDAAERAVLGDSLLAGWCAKEAAAKALGQGLAGRPRAFVIEQDGAGFQVRSTGGLTFAVSLRQEGGAAMALALAAWQ